MIKVSTPEINDKFVSDSFNIFLAGTIDNGDSENWQNRFIELLERVESRHNIEIYNPRNDNWDSSFGEEQIYKQIGWEHRHMDHADLIVYNFLQDSKSPVTMMELAENLALGKPALVICPKNFWRYTNVKYICDKYSKIVDINFFDSESKGLKYLQNVIK